VCVHGTDMCGRDETARDRAVCVRVCMCRYVTLTSEVLTHYV